MEKEEKTKYYYFYFKEPIKERYYKIFHTKPTLSFTLKNIPVQFYSLDEKNPIEAMIFEIKDSEGDHELIASSLKEYITSILKITFFQEIKFSPIQPRVVKKYIEGEKELDIKEVGFRFEFPKNKLEFREENFLQFLKFFSNKPYEIELFTEALDLDLNPILRYSCLYKIIEFTYHFEGSKDAKKSLKNSDFLEIVNKFNYENKTGEGLIEFIVDLRDKCDHLKKYIEKNEKYGFVNSNIHDRRKLYNFIPIMQQICAKVISPDLEIIIPKQNIEIKNETPLKL